MKRLVPIFVALLCCSLLWGRHLPAQAVTQTFELSQPVAALRNQLPEEARLLAKMQLKHQLRAKVLDYLAQQPALAPLDRQTQLAPMAILLFPLDVFELNEGHSVKVKILVDTNRLPENVTQYLQENGSALDTVYRHMQHFQTLLEDFSAYMQRLQQANPEEALRLHQNEGQQLQNRVNATDLFLQGCEAIGLQRWQAAENLFSQAIVLWPSYDLAYFMRGIARMYIDTYDQAIADFSQQLQLDPSNTQAYYLRGIAYTIQAAVPERAISDLSKAIESDSDNGRAYFMRGINYASLHRCDKAQLDYSKSCSLGYDKACHRDCRYQAPAGNFRQLGR